MMCTNCVVMSSWCISPFSLATISQRAPPTKMDSKLLTLAPLKKGKITSHIRKHHFYQSQKPCPSLGLTTHDQEIVCSVDTPRIWSSWKNKAHVDLWEWSAHI
jgi:hypothetical protein